MDLQPTAHLSTSQLMSCLHEAASLLFAEAPAFISSCLLIPFASALLLSCTTHLPEHMFYSESILLCRLLGTMVSLHAEQLLT